MPKKKKTKKSKKVKKTIRSKLNLKTAVKKNSLPGQEEKPEIKKIKKQPTEKKQYNINDYVVYPKHGVGKITAVEKATIGEIGINFYKILINKEGKNEYTYASLTNPTSKKIINKIESLLN